LYACAADLKFERAKKYSEMVQEYELTDAGQKNTSVGEVKLILAKFICTHMQLI